MSSGASRAAWIGAFFVVLLIAFFVLTGLVVIQPIGALPEGVTIWYYRAGINLPFLTSPDGFSLENTGQVTLMSRMSAMSGIIDSIDDRIIARLPYVEFLYEQTLKGSTLSGR